MVSHRFMWLIVCIGIFYPVQAQEKIGLDGAMVDSLTRLLRHANSPAQQVPVYLRLADALHITQPRIALQYARQGLQLAEQLQDSAAWAESYFQIAQSHLQMSDLPQALYANLIVQEYYHTHVHAPKDSLRIAFAYQQVAGIYGRMNENERAIDYHGRAMRLFKKFRLYDELYRTMGNMAIAQGKLSHFDKGLYFGTQAFAYWQRKNDSTHQAICLYIIGNNYFEQGCYTEALPYFEKGLQIVPRTNDYRMYYLYRGVARVHFLQNHLDKAESYALLSLERIRKVADNSADKIQLKYAYGLLHKIYTRKKEYQKALMYLENSNKVAEELNSFEKGKEFARVQGAHEIEKQKLIIESLRKDKLLQQTALERKRLQILLLAVGILLSLVLAGWYFRSAYLRKRNNQLLTRKNQEIQHQKESIEQYAEEIHSINEELKTMNERLDEKVRERTKALRLQNTRLIEYQFINAHKVRGPLARIMGLVSLIRECDNVPEYPTELLVLLERSAQELDTIIHEIKNVLATDETHSQTQTPALEATPSPERMES